MKRGWFSSSLVIALALCGQALAQPAFEIDEIPAPPSNSTPFGNWAVSFAGTFQGYISQSFESTVSDISRAELYVRSANASPNNVIISIRRDGPNGPIVGQQPLAVSPTTDWQGVDFSPALAVTPGTVYYLRIDDADGSTSVGSGDFVYVAAHYNQTTPVYTGGIAYINVFGYNDSDLNVRIYGTVSLSTPGAPTIGTATAGDGQASVTFTAPASDGGSAITGYTATSSPGSLTGTCSASPCTVSGLTNDQAYTFSVTATNALGTGAASTPSNSVTPRLDTDGDGTPDSSDEFPTDPLEDVDSDSDGIGDNGDAGGTGVGIQLSGAPPGCGFSGPVTAAATSFTETAPGDAFATQLSFVLANCGASVTVQAIFGEPLPAGATAYKVASDGSWQAIPGAVVSGDRVTYTIADNGPLDEDAVLGQITDPVTVVSSHTPLDIPAMPVVLLNLLAVLTGLLGLRARRTLTQTSPIHR